MPMPARTPLYRDVHLLRTLIVNIITLSVALALRRNRRNNPEIPIRGRPAGSEAPYVQVIVPARNEERHVRDLLLGLLAQRYPPGRWSVILVDDGSEDSTAEAARQTAASYAQEVGTEPPVRIIAAPELPVGWTGKSHALWAGYSKTLFWVSGRSLGRALLTATALALYALAPTLSLAYALAHKGYVRRREALLHAPLQLAPMLALRVWICRQMSVPAAYAVTYPLGVAVGDAMLVYSIYRVMSGKGVRWEGRTYRC